MSNGLPGRRSGIGCHLVLLSVLVGALSACAPAARSATPTITPPAPAAQQSAIRAPSRSLLPAPGPTAPSKTRTYFTEVYTSPTGQRMTYYLYVPQPYNPGRSYPLVLLLHGGGEVARTTNTPAQNAHIILSQPYVHLWETSTVQQRWPCFVVVPQVVAPSKWVDVPATVASYTLASEPTESLLLAQSIVTALQLQFPTIDARRIYLTGISMGGFGAWEMAERWPTMFAAAAPVSGSGDPSQAHALVHLPLWAFHGTGDPLVPVAGTRDMIQAITAAGGHPLYTEIPSSGHDIWVQVYSNATFLTWFFSQERPLTIYR